MDRWLTQEEIRRRDRARVAREVPPIGLPVSQRMSRPTQLMWSGIPPYDFGGWGWPARFTLLSPVDRLERWAATRSYFVKSRSRETRRRLVDAWAVLTGDLDPWDDER
jgi:hypothetical protein